MTPLPPGPAGGIARAKHAWRYDDGTFMSYDVEQQIRAEQRERMARGDGLGRRGLSGLRMGLLLLERLLFFERLLEYLPVDTAVAGSAQRVGELLRVGDIANRRLIIATSDPNPVGAALIVRQGKATGATLIFSGPERADRRGVMLDHTRQDFLAVLQHIALWLRLGRNRCGLFDFRGSGRSRWPRR